MKSLILCLTLILGFNLMPASAMAEGFPTVPTFAYLDSKPAKLVSKPLKVKKSLKSVYVPSVPTDVRFISPRVSGVGKASYYWTGKRTANGEAFNPNGISCAHKTLPFDTRIRVTNLLNGESVVCRVNDRGPFIKGRVVDLSLGAARAIHMTGAGVVPVSISVL